MLIRAIEKLSEMIEVEELQKEIWGVDDREILPALAMIPVTKVGGLLLGAFDNDQMIGFVFAFPGFESGRRILHSDMLAVKREYRSHGIGHQLKLAQRTRALEQGIDTITWTFDPLQSLNAHLNFGKLGVVCDRYYRDFYGETSSFLHSTGTDRMWVIWKLNSERVNQRIQGNTGVDTSSIEAPSVVTINEMEEPIEAEGGSSVQRCVEIPFDINALIRKDPELGGRWRVATRNAFTKALGDGFFVEDFYLVKRDPIGFGRYLLTKSSSL
jgi:predicted GNAT superfamily acetyltransferase